MSVEKGKTSNGYALERLYFTIADLGRGGYCAFMGNSIINMITIKNAMSNFFATNAMLTFHKHPLLP